MSEQGQQGRIHPADQKDIQELESRVRAFREGREEEERFKHYRLTRGVYGQRQSGVQMFRIKIPYGRLTADQLDAIADISEHYTNGNLHLTTRQNIQLHHVKLEYSPAIWEALAVAGLTAREACGNTVRNLTASARAGIDPEEPFDVSPYVQAAFEYFLRNPICQDMGRKIKPAFSSSERDSAFTYFHDFGFIPRLRDGERGFKVVVGGGLGAVSMVAPTAYEFLPADQIIPFMEACIRVFDRYGEREKRMKARMKFLVKKWGLERFLETVAEEWPGLKHHNYPIDPDSGTPAAIPAAPREAPAAPINSDRFAVWRRTNVFEQKQAGFLGVQLKVRLGDIDSVTTRQLTQLVRRYAADDIRITVNQGLLLRFVRPDLLPALFNGLDALGLADPGFHTLVDVTACPGTDTCALGVTNSTSLARRLEEVVRDEYPELIDERNIRIKISGCMNSCGQHMAANIGFHGSSIKNGKLVVPAMQVVLGGGVDPEGRGFIAEKVIKLPTKRIPQALRYLLDDYRQQAATGLYFNDYFRERGKKYFYQMLKPLADTASLQEADYQDWGQQHRYRQSIGVGECAGASLDVVGAIIGDAEEKIALAGEALREEAIADSIYHSYTGMVIGAKALLLSRDVRCNTHQGILNDFQQHFVDTEVFAFSKPFADWVLRHRKQAPQREFAEAYGAEAAAFVAQVRQTRDAQLAESGDDKVVVSNHYKA